MEIKQRLFFFFREEDQLRGGPHHPHRRSERGGVPQAGLRRHHRVLPHQNHQQVPSVAQAGGHSQNYVTGRQQTNRPDGMDCLSDGDSDDENM